MVGAIDVLEYRLEGENVCVCVDELSDPAPSDQKVRIAAKQRIPTHALLLLTLM